MIRVYTCSPVPGPYGNTTVLGTADGTSIEFDESGSVTVTFGVPHDQLGKLLIPSTNVAAVQRIDETSASDETKPESPQGKRKARP